MRILLILVLTVLICSCCGNTGTKQIGVENKPKYIRIISRPDSLITRVSEIASDIKYIPLQPSVNSPIGAIDKIVTRGNKIYINLIDNIVCFDNKGRFLYKLYGNGDNEKDSYVVIYDYDIDTRDSSLIVLYGNKILHFKNTGLGFEYIRTIKLGRLSPSKLDFVPGTNDILLSSYRIKGFDPVQHILINIKGDTLTLKQNYFKRFNPIKNYISDRIFHYQFDNKLYVRERLNDTVFSINFESNYFTPALILDSRMSSTNSENINDPKYFRMLPFVVKILEVPRYLFYSYTVPRLVFNVYYDKYEYKIYQIDQKNGALNDDIGGGPDFDPEYCSEGKMYSWISARALKN